jgi:hypothetical protein
MSHHHLVRRWSTAVVGELAVQGVLALRRLSRRAAAAVDRAEATSGRGGASNKETGREQ